MNAQPAGNPSSPPVAASALTIEQFINTLTESGLFGAQELQALVASLPPAVLRDPRSMAQELVRQGKLTTYQANMLVQGRSRGLLLENYVVLEKIGQGGMGVVFKGKHKRMERVVALKVLSPAITTSPKAVQRFQREVVAAARLNHPNIVSAYDAQEYKGYHFLVMEYVQGRDLARCVKESGPLPIDEAVSYVLQTAKGLEHAHAAGIIHRDIKPGNILVDAAGTAKVLDLGLARFEDSANAPEGAGFDLTAPGHTVGTCDYMAPEQAINTKKADSRADIYSLGCTLFYLITGKTMYGGNSQMAKLLAHRQQPIPPLRTHRPEAPDWLEAVYVRMVAKDPNERYQTMREVIEALESRTAGVVVNPTGAEPFAFAARRTQTQSGPGFFSQVGSALSAVAQSLYQCFMQLPPKVRWPLLGAIGLMLLIVVLVISWR